MVLLHNLAYVFYFQGDFNAARELFEEILAPTKEMDDKTGVGYVLLGLGLVELAENNPVARNISFTACACARKWASKCNKPPA
jgi:hypothetical protein